MGDFPVRKDTSRIIGIVLASAALIFSFVCARYNEYGFRVEVHPALMPGWSGAGMEDIVSLFAALLLLIAMIVSRRTPQCACVIASLCLYITSFCLYALHYSDNVLEFFASLLNPYFILLIAPFALSLAGAIWTLTRNDDKSAALLALAFCLSAFALLLLFLEVIPFGDEFASTRYLSTFLRYSATWLCVPFACANMTASADRGRGQVASNQPGGVCDGGMRQSNMKSSAETVKALKELLDMGAITEEEYESKKKDLLGL
ncbi:SHOCT domain-containing protein [Collinsella intestinalis]|uniref:SHOCT domain-containing protein n=1 Tax=Collinsella intestinalis TaxID=147207 RepID=UPI0022E5242C|nr:SHOCT domain-containing protein [Collinsella intestinalis]